jgi:hypothetical protein
VTGTAPLPTNLFPFAMGSNSRSPVTTFIKDAGREVRLAVTPPGIGVIAKCRSCRSVGNRVLSSDCSWWVTEKCRATRAPNGRAAVIATFGDISKHIRADATISPKCEPEMIQRVTLPQPLPPKRSHRYDGNARYVSPADYERSPHDPSGHRHGRKVAGPALLLCTKGSSFPAPPVAMTAERLNQVCVSSERMPYIRTDRSNDTPASN